MSSTALTSAISPPTLALEPVCLSSIEPLTVTSSKTIFFVISVFAPSTIPITPPKTVQSFAFVLLYLRVTLRVQLLNEMSVVALATSVTHPTRPPTKFVKSPLGDAVTSAVTLSIVKAPLLYADTEPI